MIIEYGSGNRAITSDSNVNVQRSKANYCEINDEFFKHLKLIQNQRLIVVKQFTENIIDVLNKIILKILVILFLVYH